MEFDEKEIRRLIKKIKKINPNYSKKGCIETAKAYLIKNQDFKVINNG